MLRRHVMLGVGALLAAPSLARAQGSARADGYTLLLTSLSPIVVNPALNRNLPYDPQRDFSPVTQITSGVQLCVVNADIARRNNWTDFSAMIRWARANPGRLRGASSGAGTTSHLLISALGQLGGAEITHVPYRGGAPAMQDMLAGVVEMMFDVPTILLPHVTEGKLKAMAVSSADEFPLLPGVPGMRNFRDVGLGDLDVTTWNAMMAPKDTPPEIVARQFAALRAIAAEPAFVERFRTMGFLPTTSESPAALAEKIRHDTPIWRRLVEISGARLTV